MQIFQAFGGMMQANKQADMMEAYGEMQAQAYAANAQIATMNAAAERQAAEANAELQSKENAAKMGALQAQVLGQGFALEGTPLLMVSEQARTGELKRLQEIYKGERAAVNYENEAKLQNFYGEQARAAASMRADAARSSGMQSMFSSLGQSFGGGGGRSGMSIFG